MPIRYAPKSKSHRSVFVGFNQANGLEADATDGTSGGASGIWKTKEITN
jgi:hypothetical protein